MLRHTHVNTFHLIFQTAFVQSATHHNHHNIIKWRDINRQLTNKVSWYLEIRDDLIHVKPRLGTEAVNRPF